MNDLLIERLELLDQLVDSNLKYIYNNIGIHEERFISIEKRINELQRKIDELENGIIKRKCQVCAPGLLNEAMAQTHLSLKPDEPLICPACKGEEDISNSTNTKKPHKCPMCNGLGKTILLASENDVMVCQGKIDASGRIWVNCKSCEGKGIVWG